MDTKPYWQYSTNLPSFPAVSNDLTVDVVIVGAGLTGITAAYLLKECGAKVALLDRQRCAAADTAHTTAHLTYVTDYRLHEIVKHCGKESAKAFWEAGAAAIDQIDKIVRSRNIDCEFKRVPGFLHGSIAKKRTKEERDLLEKDASLAKELGFQVHFVEEVPYAKGPGVKFLHQAKFHPLKYLAGLLPTIGGDGSYVFENSEMSEVEPEPLAVKANGHRIRCNYLIIATHNPLIGKSKTAKATLFQSKLALYTSYVVGGTVPRGTVPEGLYWDTTDPYYYLRVDSRQDGDYIIFGGEDVKTGQEKGHAEIFGRLEGKLKGLLPEATVQHRWLGQVVETNDGLPFIGENEGQQFIATGFCGNGFTLGTLSAVMARDRYLGKKNPWFDLFRVDRRKFHGGTWRYIKENLDYPYYMVRDRVATAEDASVDGLKIGEGRILKLDGKKVAAYRDDSGKVILHSPVCTHLGCLVHWNPADKTWDCPCHGSRFNNRGEVFAGPAESPLEHVQWPSEA